MEQSSMIDDSTEVMIKKLNKLKANSPTMTAEINLMGKFNHASLNISPDASPSMRGSKMKAYKSVKQNLQRKKIKKLDRKSSQR